MATEYRLQNIREIQTMLTDEREKRSKLSNKYHKCIKIISGIDGALASSIMILEAIVIGMLSTAVLTAPAIIAIQGVVMGAGAIITIGSQVKKKLFHKSEKHEKIRVLAEGELSAISGFISKALNDEKISDEEFSVILSELDKFREMKEQTRAKAYMENQRKDSFQNMFRETFTRMMSKSKLR